MENFKDFYLFMGLSLSTSNNAYRMMATLMDLIVLPLGEETLATETVESRLSRGWLCETKVLVCNFHIVINFTCINICNP